MAAIVDWGARELRLTEHVSVLVGGDNGKYPTGNSLVIRGDGESVIIDPSIDVVSMGGAPVRVDAVINSHSHEDHMPGNGLFAESRVHIHHDDLPGAQSLEGLMDVYGLTGQARTDFAAQIIDEFHYEPRPDAEGFGDGHTWSLGGVDVEAAHLPGHTRGHSGFRVNEGVFFLSDIDLTGFGPYYGDVWSDLEQFEESLVRVRDEDAQQQAADQIEQERAEIHEINKNARALLAEIRGQEFTENVCAALRHRLHEYLAHRRACFKTIENLRENYWNAVSY